MNKSKAAFLLSVRTLFGESREIWLATFTHREVIEDEMSARIWHHFRVLLMQKYPAVRGLRVVEVHPGDEIYPSHGLHYHLLVNVQMGRRWFRKACIRAGFGRCECKPADLNAGEYLAKYLAKDSDPVQGQRKWGRIGANWGTRAKDIVVESLLARNMRAVVAVVGRLGPELVRHISVQTAKYGSILAWPVEVSDYVGPLRRVYAAKSDNDLGKNAGARFTGVRVRCPELENTIGASEWVTILVKARDHVNAPF